MQDFTGVPAVVDLAAMREAVKRLGGDTAKVNPLSPVDLVIDHSVTVDRFGDDEAFEENVRSGNGAQPRTLCVPEMGKASVQSV